MMYDIPIDNSAMSKEYRIFRKKLLSFGAYQLQESVYCIHLSDKKKMDKIRKELMFSAPLVSNIRSLLLTQKQFEEMHLIAGSLTMTEKILSDKTRIIEI